LVMTPLIAAFGARNCLRLDFSGFTFFISVFCNPDSRDAHAHEDVLSYVVFNGTAELLVDPGRPSFHAADNAYLVAEAHNGLTDALDVLSPQRRFFFNRWMRTQPADAGVELSGSHSARLWATNTLLGVHRSLEISQTADGVDVRETFRCEGRPVRPRFSHLFASSEATLLNNNVTHRPSGCAVNYDATGLALALTDARRSSTYGRREPARRLLLSWMSLEARSVSARWRIGRIP
jgi:hypothetical protein